GAGQDVPHAAVRPARPARRDPGEDLRRRVARRRAGPRGARAVPRREVRALVAGRARDGSPVNSTVSTLVGSLDALVAAGGAAGLPAAAVRDEGERLAAAVAESVTGAGPAWLGAV